MDIILATHNLHKRDELQQLFSAMHVGVALKTASDFNLPTPMETGLTFVENALLKARFTAKHTGKMALSDDSGLVVPALSGAPGIHSARFAGADAGSQENIQKLLDHMKSCEDPHRGAFFYCVLVLIKHENDPMPLIAEGVWHGQIARAPSGASGFGYDPVFFLPELNKTAAELSDHEKNAQSHRHRAFTELMKKWPEYT